MPRAVALLLLLVALGGCVSELLTDETVTTRSFACAFLDPDDGRPVSLELHRERGVGRVPLEAMRGVADMLSDEGFGPSWRYTAVESTLLEGASPWNVETLQEWAAEAPVLEGDGVHLHVLWVEALEDEGHTVLVVSPGVVAVSEAAVQAGAVRLDRSEEFLARVLLWHVVGHALGAVNEGIPLNGTDPAIQEGPAGHEPDPESVMHVGWERVSTMPRTDGPYAAYSRDVLDDWRAAVGPEGACA